MSWYKTGTIAATNGSKIITGTNTVWTNPLNGVSVGRMLLLPGSGTVQVYEIESVQTDTQLTLVSAFSGTTGTGKAYAIPTTPAVSIEQFAHEFAATLAFYQQQLNGWQQILTGTGDVTLTAPDGESVTIKSQAALAEAINGAMQKSANGSDIADKAAFRNQLGLGDAALANLNALFQLRGSLGTLDLNDVIGIDYQGIWYQGATINATLARNYPVVSAGSLEVIYNAATNYGVIQRYTTHASNRTFTRYKATPTDAWSAWGEVWTSANLIKQSSTSDNTTGSVILNGGHGLGALAILCENANDYFNPPRCGFVKSSAVVANNSNWPNSTDIFRGFSVSWDTNSGFQFAVNNINTVAGTAVYIRNRAGSTNTAWQQLLLADTAQTITGLKIINRNNELFQLRPLADNQACYIRGQKSDGTNNWYFGKGGATYSVEWTNQHSTALNSIALSESGNTSFTVSSGKVVSIVIGGTSGRVLSQGHNAVADSSGYWKTSSPVVKLFADGTSELTTEAKGITTERISEGVYKITGCLGLNADKAWGGIDGGISNPKCRNGLERIWNDYEVEEDGSIIVRTYHRPHLTAPAFARNEVEGYADGDPIDIPSDVFLMVRVQMPAVEETETPIEQSEEPLSEEQEQTDSE